MIELSNVTLVRDGRTIIDGFNLLIAKGGITILVGASGTGKSSICDLIIGRFQPDQGAVAQNIARPYIGFVSSGLPLLEDRSIADNVLLAIEFDRKPKSRREQLLTSTLERFGLSGIAEKRPSEASMSERQRAAIARAVIAEPYLLIADEPAAHLDLRESAAIAEHLLREHLRGMTLLIATSDERFARMFAEATVVNLTENMKVNNY